MAKSVKKQPKGFTLVELIVYLGISSIAFLVFTSFMVDVTKNATKAHAATEVQQNARLLLSRITQEIRTARAIQSVAAEEITLTSADNQTVRLYLSGTNVEYTVDAGSSQVLSNNDVRVTGLVFNQNNNAISVQLSVEQENENAKTTEQQNVLLSSTVVPRQCIYSSSLCP